MNTLEEMQMQVAQLNMWTKAYDEGHPMVSDKQWDDAYFSLVQFEKKTGIYLPNSPTQQVDYQVVSKLEKVTHNHPMLSLDKTKDWSDFLNYFDNVNVSKDVIGMVKLDGLTCSLRYIDGKLVSAETRGNGEVGEDILHNAKVIKSIPKRISYTDELIVDGEVICTYTDFEPFSEEYKNPRNFAAGSIRLLDAHECANRNLSFVVWNIVKGFEDNNSFMDKLQMIEKLGFLITPWTSSFDWDAKEYLQDQAKELGYPIDGLVGRFDDIAFGTSLGATGHHSRAAYAFKFYDEEYDTNLIDIEWTMGRTGVLTPVAVFNPIDIEGSVVERASLHNVSVMYDTLHIPYKGQPIRVFKANMIIPQISWADEISEGGDIDYPEVCPVCGGATKIVESDSGTKNLICTNPNCEGKLINVLDHFCGKKGLDIKGLSKMTLEKLINWGWVSTRSDIFNLASHRAEWINKDGFGVKSVDNILSAIEKSKECELWRFISSLGIPLIGSTVAKDLANYFKCWGAFALAIEDNFDFEKLPNFGYAMSNSIYDYDWEAVDKLITDGGLFIENVLDTPKVENTNTLDGITVVITGKLTQYKNRDELKAEIEAHGGKVASAVSGKTNYLINNDSKSTSSKNKAAMAAGIPILTELEFKNKFLTF